jgi:hypothetical protein
LLHERVGDRFSGYVGKQFSVARMFEWLHGTSSRHAILAPRQFLRNKPGFFTEPV